VAWLKRKPPESLLDHWDLVPIDWFIVFVHGDMPWRLAKLLKPGYRHCYALRWDGFNWIGFYPHLGYTEVEILPHQTLNVFDVVAGEYSAIIHANAWQKVGKIRQPWPTFFTCVEQIKALLGIKASFVFTPWQLFKRLRGKHHGWSILKAETAGKV